METNNLANIQRKIFCCVTLFCDNDVVERAQNGIVRQLESSGEVEIQSDLIGELVMNALGQIDHVAYIRYASVYRNFREASDFGKFVKDQIEDN